jgi:uncharacterized protein YjbJ (UPF0337 family)
LADGKRSSGLDATKDYLQTNWRNLKSKLRLRWRKISEEDITQIDGSTEELVRLLRQRYGYGKAQAEIEIHRWLVEQKEA